MSGLKIGIIGAGWFASRRHAPDLKAIPDASMVAACRRDRAALDVFCDHFGIAGRYSDYREMLDREDMDAVVIASPHAHHFEQAVAALERGLHVLVEKPIAIRAVDARSLCDLAREKQLVLAVGLNPPYWPHCHQAKKWLQEGAIGELEAVEITWINSAPGVFGKEPLPQGLPGVVRPTLFRGDASLGGGGHLMDGGQHNVSELLWISGQRVNLLGAVMDHGPVDYRAALCLRLENGAVASITGVVDSGIGARRAHSSYFGSAGTIQLGVMPFRATLERPGKDSMVVDEAAAPPTPTPVEDLVRCIRSGGVPLGSPEHALEATELIEAAYAAAARAFPLPTPEPV